MSRLQTPVAHRRTTSFHLPASPISDRLRHQPPRWCGSRTSSTGCGRSSIATTRGGRKSTRAICARSPGNSGKLRKSAARGLRNAVIFDGEIVAYEHGKRLTFFDLQKRLGRRAPDLFMGETVPIYLVVFDLLYLDGRTLLAEPLTERRRSARRVAFAGTADPARGRGPGWLRRRDRRNFSERPPTGQRGTHRQGPR